MNYTTVLMNIREVEAEEQDDRKAAARAAAAALVEAAGSRDFDVEEFARAVLGEHRTEQQSTAYALLVLFQHWAKSEYDLRNKATVEAAQAIVKVAPDYLPYI